MMGRWTTKAITALTASALVVMPFGLPRASDAGRGGSVNVAFEDHQTAPSAPEALRGIRGYGKGAALGELSAPATDGLSGASSATAETAGRSVAAALKISGATMAGSVGAFALAPGGALAVFIADKDTLERFELYGTSVDGSASPVKISNGLVFGTGDIGVSSFEITPDGTRVVFLADVNHGGGVDDLFSAPIDGSTPAVRLNLGTDAPVTAYGLSPDGTRVAFLGKDTTYGRPGQELYRASVGVASSAVQISDAGVVNAAGEVAYAQFSPNGTRLVYSADAATDGVFQWFSVPATAAAPGSDVQLSAALSSVDRVAIAPNSATVVYTADEALTAVKEVYAIPIAGGTKIKLDPSMAGAGATEIAISPDGNRVGYLADQDTNDVIEVYSALIGVAGSGTRLSAAMAGTQAADTLNVSPDSTTVLYEADQNTAGTFELFGAPIDASAASSTLHSLTAPDSVGYFTGLGTPIIGRRAVYPVFGATVELFGVPFDGSGSYERINADLDSGSAVLNAFLPTGAERLMAYGEGPSSGTVVTRKVHAAPVRPDLPPQQFNVTAGTGALGVLEFEIAEDEAYGVYLQDQDTLGKPELYSAALDSDADSVANATDNCPFVANAAQAAVTFGQTVVATSHATFAWSDATEVRYVRGPLAQVGSLATNGSGTLSDSAAFTDDSSPAAGAGFYYLFAPDCAGRSYQTDLGAEPERDLAAFP